MNIKEIVNKKNNKITLSKPEIEYMVMGYVKEEINDEDMTSFIKAIYDFGMEESEIFALTEIMRDSGEQIDFSFLNTTTVDKHSTGGIGDKTTLIVAAIVASLDVPVVKMSGRGLGFTGGTVDKLESIIGYKEELTSDQMHKQAKDIGLVLMSQTGDVAPADKKMYALRDETNLVDSIPLIASSIMCKKLASGADKIVMDVKVGDGGFMKDVEKATELATLMVKIGNACGKETVAVLSNMNEPLGYAIGNVLEVEEAVNTLKGEGPKDLVELSLVLSAHMISLAKDIGYDVSYALAKDALESGKALAKWNELLDYHNTKGLIDTPVIETIIKSPKDGFVESFKCQAIGEYVRNLGAGRIHKEDTINYNVGAIVHKKVGDKVKQGEPLYTIYSTKQESLDNQFMTIIDEPVKKPKLIIDVIKEES